MLFFQMPERNVCRKPAFKNLQMFRFFCRLSFMECEKKKMKLNMLTESISISIFHLGSGSIEYGWGHMIFNWSWSIWNGRAKDVTAATTWWFQHSAMKRQEKMRWYKYMCFDRMQIYCNTSCIVMMCYNWVALSAIQNSIFFEINFSIKNAYYNKQKKYICFSQ